MPSKEILRIRNCVHITVISYFHLQFVSKSASRKILGLKLIKLDCIIIYLYTLILIQLKKLEMSWMEPVACLLLMPKLKFTETLLKCFLISVKYKIFCRPLDLIIANLKIE